MSLSSVQAELLLQPMQTADVEAVLGIEQRVYEFPWTRGNFIDSLAAGYAAQVLRAEDGQLLGYFLAMEGVGELHLLNITVAPEFQGQGHARRMLDALQAQARRLACEQIWLEVRQSNARARAIYLRYGFTEVGQRRAYYPAAQGQREDAVLMSLRLDAAAHGEGAA
ncbi:MAG: ribosomal protein S18-alanine N-acetyltransferase [Roseateles asaccharophilus]|uniref:[Ribosomal protein bS18]-alanine N-acetyltransferase n=1 Tax=Roseateles asaccharophilus TaxID=582607 RepID=A0A4R6MZU5_9BURK|nr:ribosomal protein S18-alanine N-acetyltransferase [Roseateles asaccharophilus]MDN3544290.1 ribosomal protein S18-alanine N-acetyltransferase [Roseateles asaccharophilus]TDP06371.1 [SSU ribosomal protein S18P]-alanine acetyltransferase [Roseateles asaccharophilus]